MCSLRKSYEVVGMTTENSEAYCKACVEKHDPAFDWEACDSVVFLDQADDITCDECGNRLDHDPFNPLEDIQPNSFPCYYCGESFSEESGAEEGFVCENCANRVGSLTKYLIEKEHLETGKEISNEDLDLIDHSPYTMRYNPSNIDIMILTEEEAENIAKEHIDEELWAFNTDFIASHTSSDTPELIRSLKLIQEKMCESANDTIRALISDLDAFKNDAINADGVAHFLDTYDGSGFYDSDNEIYVFRIY